MKVHKLQQVYIIFQNVASDPDAEHRKVWLRKEQTDKKPVDQVERWM
jgi:hypothetical protein